MFTIVPGGEFLFADVDDAKPVWGTGDKVAWPSGEPAFLCGGPGVGKSTIAEQVALARAGLTSDRNVLGLPVESDGSRPVLYIAADRPRQIRRSLLRMVSKDDWLVLDEQLKIHAGPLPQLLTDDRHVLVEMAGQCGAGTVVIDSLKDVAIDLSSDEVGSLVNLALQTTVTAGIEVLVLHHPRKAQSENKRPSKIDDMYGSAWLGAGAGSVIFLWGEPGDPVVEFIHVKQPVDEVGPFRVIHDHLAGRSRVDEPVDLLTRLHDSGADGLTARDAASDIFGTRDPSRAQVEKARRRLVALVNEGKAVEIPSVVQSGAARWVYDGPMRRGAQP